MGLSQPDPDADRIVLRYRETSADYTLAAVQAAQRTRFVFWTGLFFFLLGFGALYARDLGGTILCAVAGLIIATGLLHGLFAWWQARSLPFPSDSTVVIDESGIDETTPRMTARMDWAAFGKVFETRQMVFLPRGTAMGFIPRRAFSQDQLDAFRHLVAQLGLTQKRSLSDTGARLLGAAAVLLLYVYAFVSSWA